MEISTVSKRYARALYDFASEGNAKEAVRTDCAEIQRLLEQSAEFSAFVENPTLQPELADQAIGTIFKDNIHEVSRLFLRFLSSKRRLNQLEAICAVYEEYSCEELGILKVKITAAHDLSAAQCTAISQKLSVQYEKKIETEVVVDPSLIGGFRIQVGDHIRDLSLITKLDQFEQDVINA